MDKSQLEKLKSIIEEREQEIYIHKYWWPVVWKYSDIKRRLYNTLTYEYKWNYSYKVFAPKEKFCTLCTVYVTERKWFYTRSLR